MRYRFLFVMFLLFLTACGQVPTPRSSVHPIQNPTILETPSPEPTEPTAPTFVPTAVPTEPTILSDPSRQTFLYSFVGGLYRSAIDSQDLVLSESTLFPSGSFAGTFASPDGRYIANCINHEGGTDTEVFDLAFGRRVDLKINGLYVYDSWPLAWTPQNELLIAATGIGPGLWRINISREEGLLFFGGDPCGNCYISAAVSPDGQTIVYSYSPPSIGEGSMVWKMNADGSGRTLILSEPSRIVGGLAYSPDGAYIAYITFADTAGSFPPAEVWMMEADGSNPQLLSNQADGGHGHRLYWSPSGQLLAFVSREEGDPELNNIHLIDLETGQESELLPLEGTHNYDPFWSPDGKWLLFVSDRSGADEIWAIGADGTNLQQLTNDGQAKRFPLWLPSWWELGFFPLLEGYVGVTRGNTIPCS